MKKRSLFAAVAMLIVSALVLTSATYAWFASSSQANVSTFTTTVSNASGSILVAAQNTESAYKTSIDLADINAANGTSWSSTANANVLTPVDVKITSTVNAQNVTTYGTAIYNCTLSGESFTGGLATSTDKYYDYTWYLKSTSGTNVNVDLKPAFSSGSGNKFVYGLVIVSGKWGTETEGVQSGQCVKKVFGETNDSYFPFADENISATDVNSGSGTHIRGVVDAADTFASGSSQPLTTAVSVDGGVGGDNVIVLNNLKPNEIITVRCLVWAEGQDSNCYGNVSNNGAGFSFVPTIVT